LISHISLTNKLMMRKILFLLFLLCSINAHSQQIEKYQAVKTSQTGGRYEIVQSEIIRSQTFKIDKYTGTVYQFVKTKDDLSTWQLVPKNVATFDTVIPDKINYQLFLGGIVVRDCFLLNINTGATWVLVKDSNDYLSFENFE